MIKAFFYLRFLFKIYYTRIPGSLAHEIELIWDLTKFPGEFPKIVP